MRRDPVFVFRVENCMAENEATPYLLRQNPQYDAFLAVWQSLAIEEREARWRNAACGYLEQLQPRIERLEIDSDDDWNFSGSERAEMDDELLLLYAERNELLDEFPEVRYWPRQQIPKEAA